MLGLDNPLHIAIVLVVVLMVFGAKRLPELGSSMGHSLRGFRAAMSGEPATPAHDVLPEPQSASPVLRTESAARVPAEPVA